MRRIGVVTGTLVALCALAPSLRADDADDVRDRLLKGPAARWEQVLKSIDGSPARVGSVLGPVFRDRGVRSPSAFAAAWLCDHAPKEGGPLLADEILHRVQDDVAYVQEMRGYLAPAAAGWGSLAAVARKRLSADGDPALASAAAWLLRYDTSKPSAQELARAWSGAPAQVRSVAAESLESLLAFRFADGAQALAWMAEREDRPFVDWVRELSKEKDKPTSPLYARMIVEARANLLRAETPEELRRYLVPSETPWVEVRQAAAKRAATVQAPAESWLPVLLQVLREENDSLALVPFLEVGRQLKRSSGDTATELARVVVARLEECCLRPDLATGLLRVLGSVGDEKALAQAYDIVERSTDPAVQEAWLVAAGAVGGNALTVARFYRVRLGRTDEADVRLRTGALEALSRGSGRSKADEEVAATVLRSVLKRPDGAGDGAGDPPETALGPRLAAVRGLEAFPGPETVATLLSVVRDRSADPALPLLAVGVLGKLAVHGHAAVEALVDLVDHEGEPTMRAEAARDLAKAVADGSDDARALAAPAIRRALAPSAPRPVRVAALQASAALADADAIPAAFALAAEVAKEAIPSAPGSDVQAPLERLLQGVVRVDDSRDAVVATGLGELAAAGALDAAASAADAAADAGAGRFRLQSARADVLRRRASSPGREPAARREDLQDADRVLRRAEQTATPADRKSDAWKETLLLHESVLALILEDPDTDAALRKSALLTSLDVALLRGDEPSARRALGFAATVRALDLTPEEQAALAKTLAELAAIVNPPPPK